MADLARRLLVLSRTAASGDAKAILECRALMLALSKDVLGPMDIAESRAPSLPRTVRPLAVNRRDELLTALKKSLANVGPLDGIAAVTENMSWWGPGNLTASLVRGNQVVGDVDWAFHEGIDSGVVHVRQRLRLREGQGRPDAAVLTSRLAPTFKGVVDAFTFVVDHPALESVPGAGWSHVGDDAAYNIEQMRRAIVHMGLDSEADTAGLWNMFHSMHGQPPPLWNPLSQAPKLPVVHGRYDELSDGFTEYVRSVLDYSHFLFQIPL